MDVHPYALQADGQSVFLLWESDDEANDRVIATGDLLVWFPTRDALEDFAMASGIELADGEQEPLDLDAAQAWLRGGAMPGLDVLLQVWNLAGDVARGTDQVWWDRGEDLDHVYDLLFWDVAAAAAPAAVTPPVRDRRAARGPRRSPVRPRSRGRRPAGDDRWRWHPGRRAHRGRPPGAASRRGDRA